MSRRGDWVPPAMGDRRPYTCPYPQTCGDCGGLMYPGAWLTRDALGAVVHYGNCPEPHPWPHDYHVAPEVAAQMMAQRYLRTIPGVDPVDRAVQDLEVSVEELVRIAEARA